MASQEYHKIHGHGEIVMIDADDTPHSEPTETTALLGGSFPQRTDEPENSTTNGSPKRLGASYSEFDGLPYWKRPNVYWLIAPYLLATLAFGGMIVPKIELIVSLVCRHYYAEQQKQNMSGIIFSSAADESNAECNSATVQKHVAAFTLVMSALAGGLCAFTVPKLGSLSDRYGRTRLIVIASCGGIINEIVTIITAKYPDVLDYRFLIIGSFFDGITGSFTSVAVLGNSYVSDCSPPSKRGVAIGYLQACLFTGLALGPVLAGQIVLWTKSILSIFYIALACHVLVILFFWFIVPESLSKKCQILAQEKHQLERDAFYAAVTGSREGSRVPAWVNNERLRTWLLMLLSANPLAPLKMFVPSGSKNSRLRRNLLLLGFVDTVVVASTLGAGTVIILYAKYMFGWGAWESSRFISLVSLFRVFVLLVVFPTIDYFFRVRPLQRERQLRGAVHVDEGHAGADNLDIWVLRLALVGDMIGVLGYVFVRTEDLFMVSAVCTSFGGLATATIQSIFTKQISAEQVGSMLGAMGLLHALGRVFAPVVFDGIYAATIEAYPQAFVVVLASIFGLSIIASVFIKPHLVLQEEDYNTPPAQDAGNQNN